MGEAIEWLQDNKFVSREVNRERVQKFIASFEPARKLAEEHGMTLNNPGDGIYVLRRKDHHWTYHLYPKSSGHAPRVWVDPNRPCPFLKLPYQWDLLDVVKSVLFNLGEVI